MTVSTAFVRPHSYTVTDYGESGVVFALLTTPPFSSSACYEVYFCKYICYFFRDSLDWLVESMLMKFLQFQS